MNRDGITAFFYVLLVIVVGIVVFAILHQVPRDTDIWVHCDDSCIVQLNDVEVSAIDANWGKVGYISIKTRPRDKLTFVVNNSGAAGMFRAMVKRGNRVYRTGGTEFTVRDGTMIDLVSAAPDTWRYAFAGWNNATTTPEFQEAKYVWRNDLCTVCTVVFDLVLV